MTRRLAAVFLGLFVTSACLNGPDDAPTLEIHYQWQGGITGSNGGVDVYSDGSARFSGFGSEPVTRELPKERLAGLRSIVHSEEFRALAPSYVPAETCCDRRLHTFVVAQDRGHQRVETLEGAGHPEVLDRALRAVTRLGEGLF